MADSGTKSGSNAGTSAEERQGGDYWSGYDWREIHRLLLGAIDENGYSTITDRRMDNPGNLTVVGDALRQVQQKVKTVAAALTAQRRGLIENKVWVGDAATAYEAVVKGMEKSLERTVSPLDRFAQKLQEASESLELAITKMIDLNYRASDRISARYNAEVEAYNRKVEAYNQALIDNDGYPPAMSYPKAPKKPFIKDSKGNLVWTPSTYPDIDDWMDGEARTIFGKLVHTYRGINTSVKNLKVGDPSSGGGNPANTNPYGPGTYPDQNPKYPTDPNGRPYSDADYEKKLEELKKKAAQQVPTVDVDADQQKKLEELKKKAAQQVPTVDLGIDKERAAGKNGQTPGTIDPLTGLPVSDGGKTKPGLSKAPLVDPLTGLGTDSEHLPGNGAGGLPGGNPANILPTLPTIPGGAVDTGKRGVPGTGGPLADFLAGTSKPAWSIDPADADDLAGPGLHPASGYDLAHPELRPGSGYDFAHPELRPGSGYDSLYPGADGGRNKPLSLLEPIPASSGKDYLSLAKDGDGRYPGVGGSDDETSGVMSGVPGSGTSGYGGMPFMPMSPGAQNAGKNGEERERTTWLLEDRDIWGTDVEDADVLGQSVPTEMPGRHHPAVPDPARAPVRRTQAPGHQQTTT